MTLPDAYVAYKSTLPRHGHGVLWNLETFTKAVPLRYPGITLKPGQTWTGTKGKYIFICSEHGEYEAYAENFLSSSPKNGSGCGGCKYEAISSITSHKRFYDGNKLYGPRRLIKQKQPTRMCLTDRLPIGHTNQDGAQVIEHIRKAGERTKLRCKCPVCSNEQWIVRSDDYQKPGNSTHCGCQARHDHAVKFGRSDKVAFAPCHLYIFNSIASTAWKVGITNNLRSRPSKSYEGLLWSTDPMPRAHAWVIEQILHYNLTQQGLQLTEHELDEIGVVWKKGEAGRTELFCPFDLDTIVDTVKQLRQELEETTWLDLLDRYIPFEDMTAGQRFRWDGGRMVQRQPSCDKYQGLALPSLFSVI